jgi:hypothetical protein
MAAMEGGRQEEKGESSTLTPTLVEPYCYYIKGLLQTPLILCMFGRAFFGKLNGHIDFDDKKPVGALILAMQAVRVNFICICFYNSQDRLAML